MKTKSLAQKNLETATAFMALIGIFCLITFLLSFLFPLIGVPHDFILGERWDYSRYSALQTVIIDRWKFFTMFAVCLVCVWFSFWWSKKLYKSETKY